MIRTRHPLFTGRRAGWNRVGGTAAALLTALLMSVAATAQEPRLLAPVFQHHAVLQRDRPITIWGRTTPGETVTVALGEARATATADATGAWRVVLPAMPAGGPFSLDARTGSGLVQTVSDLLVGDVFLCSGQSNMDFGLGRSMGGEFAVMRSARDRIRLLSMGRRPEPSPVETFDPKSVWSVASPETARGFSAACYLFAKELQTTVDVPMGLINASWGGAALEPFASADALKALGRFDDRLAILPTYIRDVEAANRDMGALWERWWRAHAVPASEPWKPATPPGVWKPVPEPMRNWKTWGVPETTGLDGMVWYRRTVTLTAEQAAQPAKLVLGSIDEVDQTWVNGIVIRNTFGWGTDRTYDLAPGILRAGENVIVLNVLSTWDAGGMIGPADKLALEFGDSSRVALGGQWLYQAVPVTTGRPPRAPWEPISGLTTLYNGMIAPLGPYGLRGALWYQGETNADEPAGYEQLLGALMAGWRTQFGADLPFLIVQLPNFGKIPTEPMESGWADLRDAERRAVAADAHAGLAVTIDVGDPNDLHPTNKRAVGARLARAARHVIYGEPIAPSGPRVRTAVRQAGRVVVTFDDVEGQLVTYSSNHAIGFELCGAAAGTCRFVAGTVKGNTVTLPVGVGPAPKRVRYAWAPSPYVNLSDRSGLPPSPFELAIR